MRIILKKSVNIRSFVCCIYHYETLFALEVSFLLLLNLFYDDDLVDFRTRGYLCPSLLLLLKKVKMVKSLGFW